MTPVARLFAVAGLLAVLTACSGVGNSGSTGGYVSGDGTVTVVDPGERKAAPVLEGDDLQGESLSTDDFAGKVMVVNIWGSWCPPCRSEAPMLKELSEQYADEVQFVGILTRDNESAALAFNRKQGIDFPSFADHGGRLELGFADSLPSLAIPTTWVVDADGKVAGRVMGEVSASTLAGMIDDVLAEASQ